MQSYEVKEKQQQRRAEQKQSLTGETMQLLLLEVGPLTYTLTLWLLLLLLLLLSLHVPGGTDSTHYLTLKKQIRRRLLPLAIIVAG